MLMRKGGRDATRLVPPNCFFSEKNLDFTNHHENLDSAKEFQCGPRKKSWKHCPTCFGGVGVLSNSSHRHVGKHFHYVFVNELYFVVLLVLRAFVYITKVILDVYLHNVNHIPSLGACRML